MIARPTSRQNGRAPRGRWRICCPSPKPQTTAPTDLIVEGAGGLLAPLGTDDCDIRDLAQALALPTLLVTRPHLGTLNHTRLTVEVARASGLQFIGMVVNHHQPDLSGVAVDYAAAELARLCKIPVLAELPYTQAGSSPSPALASALAADILRASGVK